MRNKKINRRSFIEKSGACTLGSLAAGHLVPISKSRAGEGHVDPDPSKDYAIHLNNPANAMLKKPGGAQKFDVPGLPQTVIVIRKSEKEVIAFSSRCPHRGREVNLPKGTTIVCPAHRSTFDLMGSRLSGPAPAESKLSEIPSKLNGSDIVLTLP